MENARCYMLAENRHEIVKKKKKVCIDFSKACDKDMACSILTDKIE